MEHEGYRAKGCGASAEAGTKAGKQPKEEAARERNCPDDSIQAAGDDNILGSEQLTTTISTERSAVIHKGYSAAGYHNSSASLTNNSLPTSRAAELPTLLELAITTIDATSYCANGQRHKLPCISCESSTLLPQPAELADAGRGPSGAGATAAATGGGAAGAGAGAGAAAGAF